MYVFLISPVLIAELLTSELIDTPVFYNLAPRPIKYWVSVPIPTCYAWIVIFIIVVVVTVGRVSSDAYERILQHQSDVA